MIQNPQVLVLAAEPVTIAAAYIGDWQDALEGMEGLTCIMQLAWGSGGTSVTAYLQTTLDDDDTPIDIACFTFSNAASTIAFNLTNVPVTSPVTPTNGALANNTVVNGIFGNKLRIRFTSLGVYAGSTVFMTRVHPR